MYIDDTVADVYMYKCLETPKFATLDLCKTNAYEHEYYEYQKSEEANG